MSEDDLPLSIGRRFAEQPRSAEPDAALLRLHAALLDLDEAIFRALRALDVSLGRPVSSPPEAGLRYRELGRLRDQIEQATGGSTSQGRPSFADLAVADDGGDEID